jgi:hypothetical protein
MFCLRPDQIDKFTEQLKSGEIDPKKLAEMSSQERRDLLAKTMGEEAAKQTNLRFEKGLLLKNQEKAMISWAKELIGLKPEAKRDIISRIEKMEEILNPETEQAFLEDLAAHKLGVTVTMREAAEISDIAKRVAESKAKIDPESENGSFDRMQYGLELVDFTDYMAHMKQAAEKLTVEDFKANPVQSTARAVVETSGVFKALKSAWDNSALFRQGLKLAFTQNDIWRTNAVQSFKDIAGTFGGKEMLRMTRAEILSRENALNGLYKKEGLAVGVMEESFPTSWPEKIPIFGKTFKASDAAFTGFAYRTRADVFDRYVEVAQRTGADITGMGRVVNSLTGRGRFSPVGEAAAPAANKLFFSPRFLKSQLDFLTAHQLDTTMGAPAKKLAAKNLVQTISGIAVVLGTAKMLDPDSVDFNPISSDFGSIKVGNTRFDVTGGMKGIVILAARLASMHTKSGATGKISKLNDPKKFKGRTALDLTYDFFEGKLAPVASVMRDILEGEDFQGNELTLEGELAQLAAPLPTTNLLELLQDPTSNGALILAGLLADALGAGTTTYTRKPSKAESLA